MNKSSNWWKHGVIYQIYPRSFMDSNADGIGDLEGITKKLDYLAELGVDAIWMSPIFPSPMKDFGYDISDYVGIHEMFGDMDAFDQLLEEAHNRNLRVLLDYVPNHCSDLHEWFQEARSSRDNPKRDWFIWKDPNPDGSPPNNWESLFGGSAWEWDEKTEQYYLHVFLKEQPDINWRNPEAVEAMHNVLRFWLDKGVDGFRMDAIVACSKHPDFPDHPAAPKDSFFRSFGLTQEPIYYWNYPDVHDIIRGLRKVLDSYGDDRVMMGETAVFNPVTLAEYYGKDLDEFHIPFNFLTLLHPWNAEGMKATIKAYYAALPEGATPDFVLGNHDFHRLATRFGPKNHRSAAMLQLTLHGMPVIYQGDELGMEDTIIPFDRLQDPIGIAQPELNIGRDPERTPMQWDDTANAGFSPEGVKTWLPVAENYKQVNVASMQKDAASTLNLYQSLLQLRRENPALHQGTLTFIEDLPTDIVAYIREAKGQRVLVLVNFGDQTHTLNLSANGATGNLWLSTESSDTGSINLASVTVKPHESLLVELD